jgi:hypothetical protein
LVLCVHPPDSTLLDTLSTAWFHRLWVWYQPPIHCCPGPHESVFNDSLWVAHGPQIQKQSSSVFAGPSPHCMIRPVPGNGTLNRPAGGLEPPVQIGTGPHESVFNDSLWAACGYNRKMVGALRALWEWGGLVRGGTEARAAAQGPWGEISLTRHRCPSVYPSPHL